MKKSRRQNVDLVPYTIYEKAWEDIDLIKEITRLMNKHGLTKRVLRKINEAEHLKASYKLFLEYIKVEYEESRNWDGDEASQVLDCGNLAPL